MRLTDIPIWRRATKFFYILGMIFWGAFFAISLFNFFMYKDFLNLMGYDSTFVKNYTISRKDHDTMNISYSYIIGKKTYDKKIDVGEYKLNEDFILQPDSSFILTYNKKFPKYSYIKNLPVEFWVQNVTIIVSLLFLVIITFVYRFSIR